MKLVLVASIAAVLGMGMSSTAEAHGYPASGGSIYWADENVVIGFNYGAPIVQPYYYTPTRYVYRPRAYRHDHYHGKHHGHHKGYSSSYRKGYYKGYKHGDRHDRRGRRHWDD